jgi:hypothetical protein
MAIKKGSDTAHKQRQIVPQMGKGRRQPKSRMMLRITARMLRLAG